MKNLIKFSALAILILSIASCTTDNLNNELDNSANDKLSFDARFVNESDQAVSVVVYDVNGKVTESSQEVISGEAFNISNLNNGETTLFLMLLMQTTILLC